VDGAWHQLVGVYNGINTNGGLQLYIDGQLAGSNNAPATLLNTTHDISLGSRENTSTSGYTLPLFGALDDVRIYTRALSLADVQQLYQSTVQPPFVIPAGEFDAVRLKWLVSLTGGTNLNLADPNAQANVSNLTGRRSIAVEHPERVARTALAMVQPIGTHQQLRGHLEHLLELADAGAGL
jgi:hypothetical protein